MEIILKYITKIMLISLLSQNLFAEDIAEVAKRLHLFGGQKATVQWERVFSSQRHLRRYKLNELPLQTRSKLKDYLIKHAADSDQPIVPGL